MYKEFLSNRFPCSWNCKPRIKHKAVFLILNRTWNRIVSRRIGCAGTRFPSMAVSGSPSAVRWIVDFASTGKLVALLLLLPLSLFLREKLEIGLKLFHDKRYLTAKFIEISTDGKNNSCRKLGIILGFDLAKTWRIRGEEWRSAGVRRY